MAQSNNFASQLYNQASKKSLHRNIVLSPAATNLALGTVFFGMMHCPELKSVLDTVAQGEVYREDITIVNRLFVDKDVPLEERYQRYLADTVKWTGVRVNFDNPQMASDAINAFVHQTSDHKVPSLFHPTRIGKDTKMVVASAAHFHSGKWATSFSEKDTRKRAFTPSNGSDIQVDTMETNGTFYYGESKVLDAKVLVMPYHGSSELSMMIILPRDRAKGLEKLSELVEGVDLIEVRRHLGQSSVHLQLPKFRVVSRMALESLLKPLGVRSLFLNPDLRGMTGKHHESYRISTMLHSSSFGVSETSHESAFNTDSKAQKEHIPFRVNHPFIFAVMSRDHIYFMGHVAVPK